ncbi:MAG: hypothetical protein R3271_05740 [Methylophaga sp.]|uniref:hypothetical protein n=1 Tax=Methylophaga sp. TaxID=2024840 RepID=UPI00299E8A80|nr:hypothetical protein [Methylophaga sp.]MDX1749806.1 hypothetical protein [Methylophaga sp.]
MYLTPLGLTLKKNTLGVFVVILNKLRATNSDAFSASTQRAGTIFGFNDVENGSCKLATFHHFRLAEDKYSLQQWWL